MPEVAVVGSFKINPGKEDEALEPSRRLSSPRTARTAASSTRCTAVPTTRLA